MRLMLFSLILTTFSVSTNVLACKVTTELAGSSLFFRGVPNVLQASGSYDDFSISKILHIEFPNTYVAYLTSKDSSISLQCRYVKMEVFGNGPCEFTGKILEEKTVPIKTCY